MPVKFEKITLDNGLTIVAEVNPDAHTSAVGYFVKAGARDEEPGLMGVSHFLEHMMFKGTAKRTADDINRQFDEIGANYNAFTSHESTVYWAHVLPEHMPDAVELLGDMLRPALRDEDFTLEKNVILEEIGMYDDRPQWRLSDTLLEKHYRGGPLGFRVLGTVETIKDLAVGQMRDYFQHRYSPDNITVAAAGRLEFEKLVDDVARMASAWKPTGAAREYADLEYTDQEIAIVDPRLNRHYVAVMCPGPSAQDSERYAAKVLSDVLGDDEGSRLYWALVDPGLADEADFSFMPQDAVGGYIGYASCGVDRAEQVESVLLKTLDGYAGNIDAEEIERAKNKLATSAILQEESPGGRMRGLGMQWMYLQEYIPLDEQLRRLMAVTVADVRELVEREPFKPRTIVRLGPGQQSGSDAGASGNGESNS